jgi:hypothetical protein
VSPEEWAHRAGYAEGEELRSAIERIAAGLLNQWLRDVI